MSTNPEKALVQIRAYLDAGHSLEAIRQAGWGEWIDHFEARGVELSVDEAAAQTEVSTPDLSEEPVEEAFFTVTAKRVHAALTEMRKSLAEATEETVSEQELEEAVRAIQHEVLRADNTDALTAAHLMIENGAVYSQDILRMWRDTAPDEHQALVILNLFYHDWLMSYIPNSPSMDIQTHTFIQSGAVIRSFLVGVWAARRPEPRGGLALFRKLKAYKLPSAVSPEQAEQQRVALLDGVRSIGIDVELAEKALQIVADQSTQGVQDQLRAIHERAEPVHVSQLDLLRKIGERRLRMDLPPQTTMALMVLFEHSTFKALLVGHRLATISR